MSNANFDNEAFHADVWSSTNKGTRRLQVESQRTSFEENREFRFVDEWDDVPFANQIVYFVTITDPLVLFGRTIFILTGGRKYQAFPANGVPIFTGTLASTGIVTPISTIPLESGDPSPANTVVFQRADGENIFDRNGAKPTTIDFVVSSGNINQTSGTYSADGAKVGVIGGVSFWLVLDPEGANIATRGGIMLDYELKI